MKKACKTIFVAMAVVMTVLLLASCGLDMSVFVGGGVGSYEDYESERKPVTLRLIENDLTEKPNTNNSSNSLVQSHKYGQWIAEKSATCTESGTKGHYTCSHCGKYFDAGHKEIANITIPAKGHSEVIDEKVEPTTASTGLTEGKHCSVCGAVLVAQQEIPKIEETVETTSTTKPETTTEPESLGHDFSLETATEEYLKSEADCTHAAVYYKSCSRCGVASDIETFEHGAALGHAFTAEVAEERYLKSGDEYYKSCRRCGAASTTETFIRDSESDGWTKIY